MTFERAMVILFTKVAQTVIAERFTHTFFDNDGNRVRKVFAYLFSVFIRSVYKELHADHETGAADNK